MKSLWPNLHHCRENDVTWFQHLRRGLYWVIRLQLSSIILFIHAVAPWVFQKTASSMVSEIANEMKCPEQEGDL